MPEDTGGTIMEGAETEVPAEEDAGSAPVSTRSVLDTKEGQVVAGLARIIALAQCCGIFILVVFLMRYNTEIAHDFAAGGMSNEYEEILPEWQQMVDPSIMLVPVFMAVIAVVSWGLWKLRSWGRRGAMLLALAMVVAGVAAAYTLVNEEVTVEIADDTEYLGVEDDAQLMQTAAALAVFYVLILGSLMVPTVGRVFALATAEHAEREKRFTIDTEAPRSHFKAQHEVEQL